MSTAQAAKGGDVTPAPAAPASEGAAAPAGAPPAHDSPEANAPAEPTPPASATPAPALAPVAPAPSAAPEPNPAREVDISGDGQRGNVKAQDSYDGPPLLLGGGRKIKVGGYASLGGAYTRFIGKDSGLVSLEGALLLDHRLSLGLVGYGFTRTPDGPDALDGDARQFGAGYGGAAFRYSVFFESPVYVSLGVVLGAGAVNLHRDHGWDDEDSWDDGWNHHDDAWDSGEFDAFLVAQPELAVHSNLTRWLRVGATVGYRFTGGVQRFGRDLNGLVAGANIAFGWF